MDRPRPPPAAEALYRAHHDRSTGWLTLVCQGRESKLYLQHGDVVGARLGFGHQTEAQALLAAGQLAPRAFDRLWVRGQLADLAALCEAAGLDPSALSEARTLASVRRLTGLAEEASFMPALVGVTLPRVRGARALRAAFEALSPVPAGAWVRCTDAAAAEALLGPGDDRAFLAGLSEFRSLDAVSPAQSALVRLLEHAGLAEVLDAEAWEARGRAEQLEAERRAEEQERRRAAMDALEAARAAEEQRQAELRRRADAARRALEAARAAEESWRRARDVPPASPAETLAEPPPPGFDVESGVADTLRSPALEPAADEGVTVRTAAEIPDEAIGDAPAPRITAPEFPGLAELDEPLLPVSAQDAAGVSELTAAAAADLGAGLADLTDEAAALEDTGLQDVGAPPAAELREDPGVEAPAAWPVLTAAPVEPPPHEAVPTGRMGAPEASPAERAAAWAEASGAWATTPGQGADDDVLARAVQEVARTTSPEFPALPPPERTDPFARAPAGLGDDAPTPPRGTTRPVVSAHEAPTPPAGTSGPWADTVHVSSPGLHEAPTPPAGTSGVADESPTPPTGTDGLAASARTPPGGIVLEDEPVLEAEALVVPDEEEPVLPAGTLPPRSLVEDLTEALRRAGSEAPPELWSAPSTEAVGSRPAERAPLRLGGESAPAGVDADLWRLVQGDGAPASSFEDAMSRVDGQLESLAGLRDAPAPERPESPPESPEVVALPSADLDALVRTSFDSEQWTLATPPPAPPNPDSGRIPLASLSRTPIPAPPPARPDDDTPVELSSERRRALLRQAREAADTDPAASGTETPPPRSLEEAELAEAIEARHAALARPADRFALLGLGPDAGRDEVKHAFLELVKTFHPDRLPRSLSALAPKAARVFDALREAQEVLLDDARRAAHAAEVRGRAAPAPLDPGQAADALIAGELAMRRRDYAEAEAEFERAWNADPRPATLAARAWAIYMDPNRKSDAPRARAMMVDALKMDADCDRAHYQLGVIARVEGDVERAEKHFREAVRANPRHLEAAQELRLLEMRKRNPRRR